MLPSGEDQLQGLVASAVQGQGQRLSAIKGVEFLLEQGQTVVGQGLSQMVAVLDFSESGQVVATGYNLKISRETDSLPLTGKKGGVGWRGEFLKYLR